MAFSLANAHFFVSEEFKEVYRKWNAKEVTAEKALSEDGVKQTSFYKLVKAYEKEIAKPLYIYRRNSKYKTLKLQFRRSAFCP